MVIALTGNQNCGKTTLFNALTGMNQKVGNWAGVTLERKSGKIKGTALDLVDTPGVYSLNSFSPEETVTRDFVKGVEADAIINVVDVTSIERGLYLTTQLLELDRKVVVALNMWDLAERRGIEIDIKKLSSMLGVEVVAISAHKESGVKELVKAAERALPRKGKALYSVTEEFSDEAEAIASARYDLIEAIKKECFKSSKKQTVSEKIDKVFLNKWLALPIFAVIMFLIYFLSVGVVGTLTVELVDGAVGSFSEIFAEWLLAIGASEWAVSLMCDGVIAGVGAVLNFVPQLIILFLLLSLLETTGYMSRIAFMFDKMFRKLGLSGKSLIPFIVGTGCAVPGIMATRTVENDSERLSTTILTPFVPCSAKLPIITLFAGYFFGAYAGLVSAALYFFAIAIIVLSALLLKKLIFKKGGSSFISELPDYKLPSVKYVLKDVGSKILAFIKKAGTIILLSSLVVWFLLSFSIRFEYGVDIGDSILALLGKGISWLFYPMLGTFSWEASVSAIQGLIAKEQVVSSMAVIAGLSADVTDGILASGPFAFFTGASAFAFMVFNLFSAPCFGAISAMKKELGGNKRMILAVAFQTGLAFLLSYIVFFIGTLFGG